MKKILITLLVGFGLIGGLSQNSPLFTLLSTTQAAHDPLLLAYQNRQSDVQVEGRGRVVRLLKDDNKGSRHQRFLLALPSGQTLLIAHNIDLAPRIDTLKVGDTVAFYGEYEWNNKGGVVHWTHHDPKGRHPGGWLKHNGKRYQ
ncbi:hypothetical protein CBP31_06860 [Oceanisphaera profunda]|uniref:Uncharacterized protein n=1 Tax=Oceanisphaera profunda TaxID=1416627 RepID=A0A1Y0D5P4_9GAMM|nr:DUF3465 domain-containing protein [Oceanisphaera profunda]ART82375.1 hypothetical protein CBP31_06860 [Oceanisphaera profunda]